MQLIAGLQHQYALPAYRNDNELILLELGRFIARQTRWPGRSRLRKRFKVADDRIRNAHKPCEEARAQNNVEEMAARSWLRSRVACHNRRTIMNNFARYDCAFLRKIQPPRTIGPLQIFLSVNQTRFKHLFGWRKLLRPAFVMTDICECLRRLCGYRAQREPPDRDRERGRPRRRPREHWSSASRPR